MLPKLHVRTYPYACVRSSCSATYQFQGPAYLSCVFGMYVLILRVVFLRVFVLGGLVLGGFVLVGLSYVCLSCACVCLACACMCLWYVCLQLMLCCECLLFILHADLQRVHQVLDREYAENLIANDADGQAQVWAGPLGIDEANMTNLF